MSLNRRKKKWTKESVLQESKKYTTRTEFAHGAPGAFGAACKNGWLSEMLWHIPKVRNWTKESVFEESHKYTSRTEFARKCVGAYMAAKKNGWLDEFIPQKMLNQYAIRTNNSKQYSLPFDTEG